MFLHVIIYLMSCLYCFIRFAYFIYISNIWITYQYVLLSPMREIEENKLKHTISITITFEGLLVTNKKKTNFNPLCNFLSCTLGAKGFWFSWDCVLTLKNFNKCRQKCLVSFWRGNYNFSAVVIIIQSVQITSLLLLQWHFAFKLWTWS